MTDRKIGDLIRAVHRADTAMAALAAASLVAAVALALIGGPGSTLSLVGLVLLLATAIPLGWAIGGLTVRDAELELARRADERDAHRSTP